MPGILILSLLYLQPLKLTFRIIATWNTIIILLHFLSACISSYSKSIVLENVILVIALSYYSLYMYTKELKKRLKFYEIIHQNNQENEKLTYMHGFTDPGEKLMDCIEELENLLPMAKINTKTSLMKILDQLKFLSANFKFKETFSDVNNLTQNLDEEDKIYIQQSFIPTQTLNLKTQNKFKQRGSIDKFVEKILTHDAIMILKQVSNNWNINLFKLDEVTNHNPIKVLGKYCLKLYDLIDVFSIPETKIDLFFENLQKNYKENPYHNAMHGADILTSALYLISNSELCNKLSDLEIFIVIISHLGHDVGHPGYTNRFLINIQDPLAIRCNIYSDNDISVLESMHVSFIFDCLSDSAQDIIQNTSKEQFLMFRK